VHSTGPCAACGAPRTARPHGGGTAEVGPLRAQVEPHELVDCHDGHAGRAVDAALLRAVSEQLTVARRRWRGGDHCGGCSAALDLPMRATTRAITVTPEGTAPAGHSPFTVTFELPVTRCGGCAVDNVPSALLADVRGVAMQALRATD
jgi:hypothetical protein